MSSAKPEPCFFIVTSEYKKGVCKRNNTIYYLDSVILFFFSDVEVEITSIIIFVLLIKVNICRKRWINDLIRILDPTFLVVPDPDPILKTRPTK
jgi:hypothetical protein